MKTIVITSQEQFDALPDSFDEFTVIEIRTPPNMTLRVTKNRDSSSVEAWDSSRVVARGSSSVVARGSSRVVARDSSSVEAWGSSRVVARGSSSVEAWDSSSVEAWGSSRVVARDSSSVEAWDSSSVEAWGSSSVEAWDSSSATYDGERLLQYLEISPIGSRQDKLRAYITTTATTIRTGCFSGTIPEFEAAVAKTHKDSTHAENYTATITMIRDFEARLRH